MSHETMKLRPKIALYEPDIPQNTGAIIRICSCLGADLEIIEPCGFLFSDKRFKRVVMDYMDEKMIKFYRDYNEFFESKKNQRVILMTTKTSVPYATFNFKINVLINNKLKIPMINNKRSLNIASSVAIILAENLRQNKFFNNV